MRKFILSLLVAIATVAGHLDAAAAGKGSRPGYATGRVVNEQREAIAYATVVLMQENRQVSGATTDDEGRFAFEAEAGDYLLTVSFLGYETLTQAVRIDTASDLGDIVLKGAATTIEDVVVQAQAIRREADRFVVDIPNLPSALGKDGVELLRDAPGIFIQDETITINGVSGTKVYINEREVRLTGTALLNYLRNLRSDQIQRIEVVPLTGADYDASSKGGIIKITLKSRRNDGLMGSLNLRGDLNDMLRRGNASGNIDYHTGRWTLSGWGYYSSMRSETRISDKTFHTDNDNEQLSESDTKSPARYFGGNIGAVYEINSAHSIGAEVEYGRSDDSSPVNTVSRLYDAATGRREETSSFYDQQDEATQIDTRFNYIARLDTLGSTFKLLADYTTRRSTGLNDYTTRHTTLLDGSTIARDSIYRSQAGTDYDIANVSAALEKRISPRFTLKAGAKYNYNLMRNDSRYDYQQAGAWQTLTDYNYDVRYTEHIAALYAIGVARLGRWGITAGLRGEYTHTSGRDNGVRQNYLSLFPNANVSLALTENQAYSLVAQYARTIDRPGFWSLNPQRTQLSDYLYQTGNPALRPGYVNSLSLTAVLKYKYTITLVAQIDTDEVQQIILNDPYHPNTANVTWENLDRTHLYAVNVSLPFQLTKWWTANVNGAAAYTGTRIRKGEREEFHPMLFGSLSMNFTLPAKFFISADYFAISAIHISNVTMKGRQQLGFALKKRLCDDKLTLTARCSNIFIPNRQTFVYRMSETTRRETANRNGWGKPMFGLALTWNFNSGQRFHKRTIESDSDTGRLGGSSNNK